MTTIRLTGRGPDPATALATLSVAPTPRLSGRGADGIPYAYAWYAKRRAVERWIDRSITTVLVDRAAGGDPFSPFVAGDDWILLYVGLHKGTTRVSAAAPANHPSGRRYTADRIHNQVGGEAKVRSLGGDTLPTQLNIWFGGAPDAERGKGKSLMDRVRDSLQERTTTRDNTDLELAWCQAEVRAHPCPGLSTDCCPGHVEHRLTKLHGVRGLPVVPGARPLMNYQGFG